MTRLALLAAAATLILALPAFACPSGGNGGCGGGGNGGGQIADCPSGGNGGCGGGGNGGGCGNGGK